jgi:hypothetical protein
MNNIHSLLRGQACAFDFIQCISSSISSHIDSIAKNVLQEQEARQVEEYYNRANRNSAAELNARKNAIDKQNVFLQDDSLKKQQNENRNSKQKTSTSTSISKQSISLSDLAIPTPPVIPKAPVMPIKKWTEIPEYRTAYLEALNQGLSGQTARDHAKLLLTYVLAEVRRICYCGALNFLIFFFVYLSMSLSFYHHRHNYYTEISFNFATDIYLECVFSSYDVHFPIMPSVFLHSCLSYFRPDFFL